MRFCPWVTHGPAHEWLAWAPCGTGLDRVLDGFAHIEPMPCWPRWYMAGVYMVWLTLAQVTVFEQLSWISQTMLYNKNHRIGIPLVNQKPSSSYVQLFVRDYLNEIVYCDTNLLYLYQLIKYTSKEISKLDEIRPNMTGYVDLCDHFSIV
jgi:hypothetical protein